MWKRKEEDTNYMEDAPQSATEYGRCKKSSKFTRYFFPPVVIVRNDDETQL